MKLDALVDQASIETDRMILRPLRKSDAGLLGLYSADVRVAEATQSIPHPYPPGAAEAYVARAMAADRTEDVWALDGSRHGLSELLGLIVLQRMDRGQSEISFWVAPAFWKIGIASEAIRALIAANPQEARTYFASVFQDNPGSARVLTNAGFEYIGDAEAYAVARGKTAPTWTYILRLG
ncbi:MAG: GNAT family N-acetyltransferase [Pseudomonadota bacterium]